MKALKPIGGAIWLTAKRVAMDVAACIERCCTGGGRYKVYLQKYCSRGECKDLLWEWSDEIAYNDIRWGSIPLDTYFKFSGVCYFVVWTEIAYACESLGPSCFESIRYGGAPDGPPIMDVLASCGRCCPDQDHCQSTQFWSCAEQRWKCYECGNEYGVYIRATKHIYRRYSNEFRACIDRLNRNTPGYFSCWPGPAPEVDIYETSLLKLDYSLRPTSAGPNGEICLSLWRTCLQNYGTYRLTQWTGPFGISGGDSCRMNVEQTAADRCGDPNGYWNTGWAGGICGQDHDPFGAYIPGSCGSQQSGSDPDGRNRWTRTHTQYQDGQVTSARVVYDLYQDTSCTDDNGNEVFIPHAHYHEEYTYIRQHTVLEQCDGDTQYGCGIRPVCAENRPPPPTEPPPFKPKKSYTFPKKARIPAEIGPSRRANPLYNPPQSTGGMF